MGISKQSRRIDFLRIRKGRFVPNPGQSMWRASTRSGLYAWSGDQTAMGVVMLRETCFDNSPELLFTKHFSWQAFGAEITTLSS